MNAETVKSISLALNNAVSNILFLLLFNRLYKKKYDRIVYYIIGFLILTICSEFTMRLGIPIINICFSYLSLNLICICLYKCDIKKCWLYNMAILIASSFCEILSVIVWMIIKGEKLEKVLNSSMQTTISSLFNILLFFCIYRVFVLFYSKKELFSIRIKEIAFFTFMVIMELYILLNYNEKASGSADGVKIIIILCSFFVLNAYVVYMLEQISKAYKDNYKIELLRQQNKLQLDNYVEIDKKYQASKKTIHDIKKHLEILSGLNSVNEEKAEKYRKMIENDVDSLFTGFQCTNQILSIIMSQKIAIAEDEGITVKTEIEDISFGFMDDLDITALFSNLWDNAIEACRKVSSDREIQFFIEKKNDFILINVVNTFETIIEDDKGRLVSTKADHEGVGISIIRATVEKYNGFVEFKHNDYIFTVEVTLSISENPIL